MSFDFTGQRNTLDLPRPRKANKRWQLFYRFTIRWHQCTGTGDCIAEWRSWYYLPTASRSKKATRLYWCIAGRLYYLKQLTAIFPDLYWCTGIAFPPHMVHHIMDHAVAHQHYLSHFRVPQTATAFTTGMKELEAQVPVSGIFQRIQEKLITERKLQTGYVQLAYMRKYAGTNTIMSADQQVNND